MDGSDVVKIVDSVEEFFEFFRIFGRELNGSIGDAFEFGFGDGETGIEQSLTNFHEVARSGDDFETVFGFIDVFGASIKDGHHGVFAFFGDKNEAFAGELEHNRTGIGHAATVFGESVADFGHGAVFIVGSNFDDDAGATRAVTFVSFLNKGSGRFISNASDSALDVDLGHVGLASLFQHHGKGRVHVGIGTTTGSDGDLISDFSEKGTALSVDDGFLAFGGGPFAVSGHIYLLMKVL